MAKAKRRKARKAKKARPAPAPAPRPELNAASRAQLGNDRDTRAYRPKEDDASVEDPLGDWPEDD